MEEPKYVYDFGHYIPFLGSLFGLNVLFGAWDGVYGKLYNAGSDEAKKDKENWEEAAATLDITDEEKKKLENKRRRNKLWREGIKTGGRIWGIMTALLILVSFYFIPRTTDISGWLAGLIALAGVGPVLALVLMWFNRRGLTNIRNKENELYRQARQRRDTVLSDQAGLTTAEERIRQASPSTRRTVPTYSRRQ